MSDLFVCDQRNVYYGTPDSCQEDDCPHGMPHEWGTVDTGNSEYTSCEYDGGGVCDCVPATNLRLLAAHYRGKKR